VFYAESWALVHYLMLDPEARQRQLMKNFIAAWDKSGNQIEAAQQAFGDLKKFGEVIQAYSRQTMFHAALYKNGQQSAEKTYSVRNLPPGEVLALRGDCAAHRNRLEQAQPLIEQAMQLEPSLAIGHEAMGYYLYRKEDQKGADGEMKRAMELGATSFVAPYYHGMMLLRGGLGTPEVLQDAAKSFERATQINPQFAPAFEGLAQAYSLAPETQKEAVNAGIQAMKLDPTTHVYAINLIHLLVNDNRDDDARKLAQNLLEKTRVPEEAETARALLEQIEGHERWVAARKKESEEAADPARRAMVSAPVTTQNVAAPSPTTARPIDTSTLMAVEGLIRRIDCSHKPAILVTLGGGTRPLIFHAADFGGVGVTGADEGTRTLDSCERWKGRRVRIWFVGIKGKEYLGEITDWAFE